MSRLRIAFFVLALLVVALAAGGRGGAQFAQSQRDQIGVVIIVHVTPAPIVYRERIPGSAISLRMQVKARGSARLVDAMPLSQMVAQQQHDVRVQAEVSPNPNATMLYPTPWQVPISQVAGTTQTYSCVYTVTVDTPSTTSWTLKDGLSQDFSAAFPGKDLGNNTYLQGGAPQATATPFIVYPDNNNTWNPKVSSTGMRTYCVTLTLTIPVSVGQGAYSTDAMYTLYF